jgi:hypothetical protein
MTVLSSKPVPGQIARVRQRHYLVEQVIPAPHPGDSTLVSLSCVDDDAQGQPLQVLWEREIDREIRAGEDWEAIAQRGFDPPDLFAAYLNTLKWNCVTSTDPRLFQSPFRAGIRLDAYQLEPLRKALRLPRVNLFIADDVGLGKTIEAGLIARELLLRKKARDVVIACPPSMLLQWKDEMEARFGLTFEILDKDYVKRVRKERGFGVNPWTTHSRFLVSQRLLIDEAYAANLRDWLGTFRSGSLFILDEAHHAAPASGQRYAIDSQLTRAVRELAPRFEHRLFLSATPHNGHSNSFSALLEILDPQRFCRGVPVGKAVRDEVMVRRLKEDLREIQGGFPKRNVVQVDVDGLPADAPELRLSALLDRYRMLREERLARESKRKQAASGLLITGLQQRLLSSIEAFARTLHVHRRTVQRQWAQAAAGTPPADARLPITADLLTAPLDSDDDRAILADELLEAEEHAQFEAMSAATMGPLQGTQSEAIFAQEQALLEEMTEIAETSRRLPDARVRRLLDWMQANQCPLPESGARPEPPPRWTNTRILIFTEYEDTRRYLQQQLQAAITGTHRADDRIHCFTGSTPEGRASGGGGVPTREEIKLAFNAPPDQHPVRILIATDAAREGLNLQAHCAHLFHFDVPWNPSRMEQRNGRIDRKLQPAPEVFCHYFVYRQRPEDRILTALVRKTETIRQELGSLSPVVDARLNHALRGGIRRDRLAEMVQEITEARPDADHRQAVDEELEAVRERQDALRRQIDLLRNQLADSERSLGFDEQHFRAAISCALQLVGGDPLRPDQEQPGRALFPELDRRSGADPSWADTLDTLRAPRKREQKPWEWRRDSPVRPVVFADPGIVTDEVVHLHLEHRVVQRLLGHFTAQGFVYHDLSRACLAQSHDAVPRVLLLGRLCLYGPGAARLHEEIVPITARWTDPHIRKSPLRPYAREAESRTLTLLDAGLLSAERRPLEERVVEQLRAAAALDILELLPHLESRGEEYAADARKKLRDRGDAEAKAMLEILQTQQKHIENTIAKDRQGGQLRLGFSDDETRQLEANRRYWDKRLTTLQEEILTEPERIRELYDVRATRIEPIGLAYLWPVTG